jgi:hypothetical protein
MTLIQVKRAGACLGVENFDRVRMLRLILIRINDQDAGSRFDCVNEAA